MAVQGSLVMNWGGLEGVLVGQEAEPGRHLALELAEVRQDTGWAEGLKATSTINNSLGILVLGPLQTFLPRLP